MNALLDLYHPKTPRTMVYMLQQFEYNGRKLLSWALKATSVNNSQKRGSLRLTKRAKLMLAIAYIGWLLPIIVGLVLGLTYSLILFALCFAAPLFSLFSLLAISYVLELVVVKPRHGSEVAVATNKLAGMKATRIAVLGSYGKTSLKELLLAVLSSDKKVKATEGNKNVLISQARWVQKLDGDEEVLIFEYGEGEPGDISKFASFSKPDYAVVTGLAPAHLDFYSSLSAVADDFSKINDYVPPEKCFVNKATDEQISKVKGLYYSEQGADGWEVSNKQLSFEGTSFTLTKAKQKLKIKTQLLGYHHIGPIVAVVLLAQRLGLSDKQILSALSSAKPYEHRMQPRQLRGAWIIDDTYNGNIDGMKAGLALLSELPATRRIYVTPGLVDQGEETERVHQELGRLIAESKADKVVLMQNSVTEFIARGLAEKHFSGELSVEAEPLNYYTNLEHHLAAGDLILLQNDWPDSYN